MRAYEEIKAVVGIRAYVGKSNSNGTWSVLFSSDRSATNSEEYVRWIPKTPNGESVAVVPVLIDCQEDWVSRIYLAYARTTPRNDADALQHAYERNYSRRLHDYVLSCENRIYRRPVGFPINGCVPSIPLPRRQGDNAR